MERHAGITETRVPACSSASVSFVADNFKGAFSKVSFFAFSFWRLFAYCYYYFYYYYAADEEYEMEKCNDSRMQILPDAI